MLRTVCFVPGERNPLHFLQVQPGRDTEGGHIALENSRHLATPPLVSPQMTSEKRAQKFHTDDASLPRFGSDASSGISGLVSQTSFGGGSIAKCWLFLRLRL